MQQAQLYRSELPTARPIRGRRHWYEAILVSEAASEHRRWIRSIQRKLLREQRGGEALVQWPRRYRLGHLQRYGHVTCGFYSTSQALVLLLHNGASPVGFCGFSVGATETLDAVRPIQVSVDAVWIKKAERGQFLSDLMAARVAEVALALAQRLESASAAGALVRFELYSPQLTQTGLGFLTKCEAEIGRQHLALAEWFPAEAVIDHPRSELEAYGWVAAEDADLYV